MDGHSDGQALLVLGMHRSGTSALSGVLGRLGVELGDSMRAPHPGVNEKGYWEHLELVELHDRLLTRLRSSWDEILPLPADWWRASELECFRDGIRRILDRDFSGARVWGLKDPRMCRLLPLWLPLLDERSTRTSFVLTHRQPFEVISSLSRRNEMAPAKSAVLWIDHNLSAERWSRSQPRCFTSFDRLLDDPLGCTRRMQAALGIEFPRTPDEAAGPIGEFVSPRLRHHRATSGKGPDLGGIGELVEQVHATLERACDGDAGLDDVFDRHRAHFGAWLESHEPSLVGHVTDLQARNAELSEYLHRLHESRLWKLGRPLRRLARRLGRTGGNT